MNIEPLESRIAPAVLTGKVLTYTDADGDAVTITFKTKATLALTDFVFANSGTGEILQTIKLNDVKFEGTALTMKVTQAGGNGVAHVGYINATGVDLGKIVLTGDLGRIDAGDADAKPAVAALTLGSFGVTGLSSQEAGGNLDSHLAGSLGALTTTGNFQDAYLVVTGKIGKITIGNQLIGGATDNRGNIEATQDIGPVKITGTVIGGLGNDSAKISSGGAIKSVFVGDSVIGGDGDESGRFLAEKNIGPVNVIGSVIGGDGGESGSFESEGGALNSVKIGGSLIGGLGIDSAELDGALTTKFINITNDIIGGDGEDSARIEVGGLKKLSVRSILGGNGVGSGGVNSEDAIGSVIVAQNITGGSDSAAGAILSDAKIGKVTIGGNLTGGTLDGTGFIFAGTDLGSVSITGNLIGGDDLNAGQIYAGGNLKKVSIGGFVQGGSGLYSGYIGADGATGTVKITGDLKGGIGQESGVVFGGLGIKRVQIDGSMTSGAGVLSGTVDSNQTIGTLKVGKDITGTAAVPVNISAVGQAKQGKTTDVAIKTITVGGNVAFARILAGYNDTDPVNPDAQIGSIKITGNLTASQIIAGVLDVGANGFGNADDTKIAGDTADTIVSSIASLVVLGAVDGTVGGTDQFGISAELVKKVVIGGTTIALTTGPNTDTAGVALPTATSGADFHVREVAAV